MQLIVVGVWNGNFKAVLIALTPYNTEIRIRQSKSRIVLEDQQVGFYKCIPMGEEIVIPAYERRQITIEDFDPNDEPITVEEPQEINSLTSQPRSGNIQNSFPG